MYPLKLEGAMKSKVWGGDDLKYYHKNFSEEHLGEIWELACHPNGASIITNGELKGLSVCSLMEEENILLLGEMYKTFPLMVKFLDAKSDLSLQVHPDDKYAKDNYNSLGKTEVWYILSADEGSEIILGTGQCSLDETMESIENSDLDTCLNHIQVKAGEFYSVPAGTIHGIGSGIVLLEIQESSDITFRLHDYGRGRELHLEEARNVINVNADYGKCRGFVEMKEDTEITHFIQNEHFEVKKIKIREFYINDKTHSFQLISCISGTGYLTYKDQIYDLKTGDQYLIPADMGDFHLRGMLDVIVTQPTPIRN